MILSYICMGFVSIVVFITDICSLILLLFHVHNRRMRLKMMIKFSAHQRQDPGVLAREKQPAFIFVCMNGHGLCL